MSTTVQQDLTPEDAELMALCVAMWTANHHYDHSTGKRKGFTIDFNGCLPVGEGMDVVAAVKAALTLPESYPLEQTPNGVELYDTDSQGRRLISRFTLVTGMEGARLLRQLDAELNHIEAELALERFVPMHERGLLPTGQA